MGVGLMGGLENSDLKCLQTKFSMVSDKIKQYIL